METGTESKEKSTYILDALSRESLVLAPMVRAGAMPTRMLALDYGCDVVYGEEIIAWRMINTNRIVNEKLNIIEYVDKKKPTTIVFSTCEREKDRVVFQIGAPEAGIALKAAQVVEKDVAAVDINMGCPKHFSTSGGMGAALLSKPEVAADIISTLRRNLSIPVFAKLRLLHSEPLASAVELIRRLEKSGVSAVAVHVRTIEESPDDPPRWDIIPPLLSSFTSIPIIANGGVWEKEDIIKIRKETGCKSVMLARGALRNMSIFNNTDEEYMNDSMEDVIHKYLRVAIRYNNFDQNTKYVLQQILRYNNLLDSPKGRLTNRGKALQEFCNIWDIKDYNKSNEEQRVITTDLVYTDSYFTQMMTTNTIINTEDKKLVDDVENVRGEPANKKSRTL